MSVRSCSVVFVAVALGMIGCQSDRNRAQQYELRGQILAIRPDAAEVVIKHGDIKNFMPGMTMPFKVRDRALLEGKTVGDLVTAQLMVAPNDAWLSALEKTGSAPVTEVVAPSPAAFVKPLEPGEPAPDTALTDQDGRVIALPQLLGNAVVVTFIYTRCPLPQFCPMMDRRFADVQQRIRSEQALAGRARLLSVSFDPDHDRPEILKAHASKLGADPAMWSFVTAPRNAVDKFAAKFGVNVIREADRTITHNLRTTVIGPDGRVVSVYNGSDWTPQQVVDDLRRALAAT